VNYEGINRISGRIPVEIFTAGNISSNLNMENKVHEVKILLVCKQYAKEEATRLEYSWSHFLGRPRSRF